MLALLAEDDEKLGRLVKNFLEEENFSADWVKSGAEALYYASNADRKKWNLPNWLFCSGKYVRAKCKCKTSHPKKRNLSNWLECTGQLLRSKFEQSKNCHPKKWNLSHRL